MSTTLATIYTQAVSDYARTGAAVICQTQLLESASLFGRPLYRALADISAQVEECVTRAEGITSGSGRSVRDLLGSIVVIGGCRTVLRSVFVAAKNLPQGLRQSIQFQLVGIQAEQDALCALMIELLEAGGSENSRINLLVKAVFEHLVRVRGVETLLVLSGEGFDSEFMSELRTQETAVLTAASTLFPAGMGRQTVEPIAANLGLS
jgi:hypothetical protein